MNPLDTIATALVVIGGLNWGIVALRKKDAVSPLFGKRYGGASGGQRVVYALVGAAALYSVGRFALRSRQEPSPVDIQDSIEVEVPLRTAYDQWTQFEEFPRFMDGVQEVRQLDDSRLHWVAEIGGLRREWDAVITEQRPDERVAWKSTEGAQNAGVVTFHRLDDQHTLVTLQMSFSPSGPAEAVASALGAVRAQTHEDLGRFKSFIESRGEASGAWRGQIQRPDEGSQTSNE
jgi:uncharacterized membrane protein